MMTLQFTLCSVRNRLSWQTWSFAQMDVFLQDVGSAWALWPTQPFLGGCAVFCQKAFWKAFRLYSIKIHHYISHCKLSKMNEYFQLSVRLGLGNKTTWLDHLNEKIISVSEMTRHPAPAYENSHHGTENTRCNTVLSQTSSISGCTIPSAGYKDTNFQHKTAHNKVCGLSLVTGSWFSENCCWVFQIGTTVCWGHSSLQLTLQTFGKTPKSSRWINSRTGSMKIHVLLISAWAVPLLSEGLKALSLSDLETIQFLMEEDAELSARF